MSSKTNTSNGRAGPKSGNETIIITNGYFSGLKMKLKGEKTLMGKSTDCDICLDHNLVSEEHAVIYKSKSGYWVEDLNSKNGTFINGREIHRKKLKNKDKISIGDFSLEFKC